MFQLIGLAIMAIGAYTLVNGTIEPFYSVGIVIIGLAIACIIVRK